MSSPTPLSQDDFNCLELAAGHDAESQPVDFCDGLKNIERAGSVESLKFESACEVDEIFCPVNFIPDEVYKLIENWELAYMQRQDSIPAVDSMDTESCRDSWSSESIFEPIRCMSVSQAPPPKRFYRTFWRSVTRRIVQLEKQSTLKGTAMSSPDASYD
mmetsp:Transcript_4643/g.10278  ORF Transcript_4643/g.10278 Transcript_4643/m.10278 type:complete len:159 (-) Transcript_4643:78-554(-)